MATPERTMATTSGVAGGGGIAGAAAGTTIAMMVSAALSFTVGLMWGMSIGEQKGYWKGMS